MEKSLEEKVAQLEREVSELKRVQSEQVDRLITVVSELYREAINL